jgi:predicted kinase
MVKRMATIIVLVGNIGAGKSTLCHKLVKAGYVVIARDKLRYMIGNGKYIFNPSLEQAVYNSEQKIIEEFMRLGVNIVVDEVGVSKKFRENYLRVGKRYNYKTVALVLPRLNKEDSVDRRMNDPHGQPDRKLWESVWIKFDRIYVDPTLEEGFDKIIKLEGEEYNEGLKGFPKEHI